jgi:hypothetical protein
MNKKEPWYISFRAEALAIVCLTDRDDLLVSQQQKETVPDLLVTITKDGKIMTTKEELIKEITQAPDFLIEEVLNFLLFIKNRFKQRTSENKTGDVTNNLSSPSFLNFVDDITNQIPQTEWEKLPSDLSKNLDHYLYGSPKSEE